MADWQADRQAWRAAYSRKLKDPRWQRKRLEIFERDGWTCQECASKANSLQVHHLYYENGCDPWDYPTSALVTLCEFCHQTETEDRPRAERDLLDALKRSGLLCDQIEAFTRTITSHLVPLAEVVNADVSGSVIKAAITNAACVLMAEMADKYGRRKRQKEEDEADDEQEA